MKDDWILTMDNKPVRVLHMAPLGPGGISKLTVSINKLIDRDRVVFEYLVFRDHKEFFDDEISELGAPKRIVDVENVKISLFKQVVKFKKMCELFRREKYDVVHVDASTPYDVVVALAAKVSGIRTIVFHSHNDGFKKGNILRDVMFPFFKLLMRFCVTDYFTISGKAAEFMFPTKIYKQKKYTLVRNGIDPVELRFSPEDRNYIRDQLNIGSKKVIGHIGRFVYQKNHRFLIDIFEKVLEKDSGYILLLVGEGELVDEIKKYAEDHGVIENVVFFGTTHEIGKVLSAMDCFVFPSHFEGLGIVAIEAQANGLPTICADSIVDEVNVTDKFCRVHGWDANEWADRICDIIQNDNRCDDKIEEIRKSGYDIRSTVSKLESFYIETSKPKKKKAK